MIPSPTTPTSTPLDAYEKNAAKMFSVVCEVAEILRLANQKQQEWSSDISRIMAGDPPGPTGGYEIRIIIDAPVKAKE